MTILLINPYWLYPYSFGEHTYNRIWPPLDLANCASILEKEGHHVEILDAHALRIKPRHIKKHIKKFDKIFVTSSPLDRWICPNIHIDTFLETVQQVRLLTDEVYVMGYHGTVDPENILILTDAKAVIRGEPERTVAEICQNRNFSDMDGIAYRINGKIISTPDREDIDLKILPRPAHHLLDYKLYRYEILGEKFALFETGRGCHYNCGFCTKVMYGRIFRTKSKDQMIDEIQYAVEELGVKTGYFIDLDFLVDKDMVYCICDFLRKKKYDFKWCCQTRPDVVNEEILRLMKEAGCELIHFGVESGLQKFQEFSGKRLSIDKILNTFVLCKRTGIKTLAFFIFGFRGETATDREETFNFAKKLNPDFVSFHKIHPYEKTNMNLVDTTNDREIDNFIRWKYVCFYLRLSFLKKLNSIYAVRCLKLFISRITTPLCSNQ